MTHLGSRMLEELQRRNYADSTIESYLRAVERFVRHFKTPPDQLGADQLRQYQLHLIRNRSLAAQTVVSHMSALRFFYVKTLRQGYPPVADRACSMLMFGASRATDI